MGAGTIIKAMRFLGNTKCHSTKKENSSSFFIFLHFFLYNHRTFCVDARASVVGLACDALLQLVLLNTNRV